MSGTVSPGFRALRDPVIALALGFGSGLLPRAPGTWGTVAGIAVYLAFVPFGTPAVATVTAIAIVAGIPICGIAARRLGVHDHPAIVWDEIAGIFVTLLFVPPHWAWILAAFAVFRFFDVLKPWPIRLLDRRMPGGIGIMADDVVAGMLAGGLLYLTWTVGAPVLAG